MLRKEYVEEVRPLLKVGISFILFLRFGGLESPLDYFFPKADEMLEHAEKQFKFKD